MNIFSHMKITEAQEDFALSSSMCYQATYFRVISVGGHACHKVTLGLHFEGVYTTCDCPFDGDLEQCLNHDLHPL